MVTQVVSHHSKLESREWQLAQNWAGIRYSATTISICSLANIPPLQHPLEMSEETLPTLMDTSDGAPREESPSEITPQVEIAAADAPDTEDIAIEDPNAPPTEDSRASPTGEGLDGPPSTAVAKPKKSTKKKRRPARAQVDPATFKGGAIPAQTGTVFNIWYNKWSGGDREDKYISKSHAEGRCNISKDSGYTKADKVPGSYFCLFFARGQCPRGQECEYLHRLPAVTDLFNPNVDCFGRDKHSDYRDDMGGVGSFMRQNHTLYVGRIHVSDDIEEVVARHFAEWGQIERSTVLPSPLQCVFGSSSFWAISNVTSPL